MKPLAEQNGVRDGSHTVPLTATAAWDIFSRLPPDLARLVVRRMPLHIRKRLRASCKRLFALVSETVSRVDVLVEPGVPLPLLGVLFPCLNSACFDFAVSSCYKRQVAGAVAHYAAEVERQLAGGQLGHRLERLKLDVGAIGCACTLDVCDCERLVHISSSLPRLRALCSSAVIDWRSILPQPDQDSQPGLTALHLAYRCFGSRPKWPLVLPPHMLQHLQSLMLDAGESPAHCPPADDILDAVVLLPRLERLELEQVAVTAPQIGQLRSLEHLRELVLHVLSVDESMLQQVARLRQLTALTVYAYAQCGADLVAEQGHLRYLTALLSLRQLHIDCITLSGSSVQLLALPQLRSVNCSRFAPSSARVVTSTSLRELVCWDERLLLHSLCTADGGPASSLTKLDVGGRRPRQAVELRALRLHTGLRYLKMRLAPDVTDACLITNLGALTRLTELHICGTYKISDAGLSVLSTLSQLVILELWESTQLRDRTLVEAVQQLPALQQLMLLNIQLITPAFLGALLNNMPSSLAHISVIRSPHISAASCEKVLTACPDAAVAQLATLQVDNTYLVGSYILAVCKSTHP